LVAELAAALPEANLTFWQTDLHQADKLRRELTTRNLPGTVISTPDLWDLPTQYQTVLFPSLIHADRELKIDVIEQAFQILNPGGRLITLSEYVADTECAGWHKKVFGQCSEIPRNKLGSAFWSSKNEPQARRRHEVRFHVQRENAPSCVFLSRPGTFGYGRMDLGARALIEVAEVKPGDHVLDLGCGIGTVGVLAGLAAGETGHVTLTDSNVRACALAEHNCQTNGVKNYRVVSSYTQDEIADSSFDVVLANPPYYANSEIARRFIASGFRTLKPGGKFVLVTKVPGDVVPEVFNVFGDCGTVEHRAYTVAVATKAAPV
jgi:16S rRNA (guanine1207-N2)-methyltransferase